MIDKNIVVTNIQRFSLHDGPGIRTTVFLKGCNLRCPWCANPENIQHQLENYSIDGISKTYGRYYSCQELYDEVIKDKLYYAHQGGITYSGGEPILQIQKLLPLIKKLHEEGIHQCIETALFVSPYVLDLVVPYVDMFYVDIKILNVEKCKEFIGGTIESYLKNVRFLLEKGCNIRFRVPLISPYTSNSENLGRVILLLKKYGVKELEAIVGHNLAEKKYQSLGRQGYKVPAITENELEKIRVQFQDNGIKLILCHV
ncbi:MAG: radical SAM protein [Eubacteriales bacterium]